MKVYWSDEMYEILGLDKKRDKPEILAKSSMIAKDDKNFVSHVFEKSLKNKGNYKITYRVVRSDGDIKYLDEHAIYLVFPEKP